MMYAPWGYWITGQGPVITIPASATSVEPMTAEAETMFQKNGISNDAQGSLIQRNKAFL
jgi:hypothetical protein